MRSVFAGYRKRSLCILRIGVRCTGLAFLLALTQAASAQMHTAPGAGTDASARASRVILFDEPGFPAADSPEPGEAALRKAFAAALVTPADQLPSVLSQSSRGDLLVMPYGSSYPEAAWPAILTYLDRGGNLLVLGGKPFTRAAFHGTGGWQLRPPSVAASLELFIHDYQETPGSGASIKQADHSGLSFLANADVTPALPSFAWKRAFSPVLRLSTTDMYKADGSTGTEDADLTTLAWGVIGGGSRPSAAHKLAAPVIELDHLQHRFVGGRWILVDCEPDAGFFENAALLDQLAAQAMRREDRFTLRPRVPLFVPGEPLTLDFAMKDPLAPLPAGTELHLRVTGEAGGAPFEQTIKLDEATQIFTLPAALTAGSSQHPALHTVEATLLRNGQPLTTYRSGYWIRDRAYLLSGPKLGVGSDYFTLDGKPLPVVGTTLMASDVQRLYLMQPNAFIWDQDMAQIRAAGLNMIRSGIWSGWAPELAPNGEMSEDALRTVEAFLMCARHNGLPVQFNLLAFVADNLGESENAYLDPVALRQQSLYIRSLAARFHDVPFLAWDLINEPSANRNHWRTEPDYDAYEESAWRTWLSARYPDKAALLAAWAEPSFGIGRDLQRAPTTNPPEIAAQDPFALPKAGAFAGPYSVRSGYNPLKIYDYFLFTQSIFADWVSRIRGQIRSTGSQQLITVGQEENGVGSRLSPAFYSQLLDFTADHTWWDFDGSLWASLAAKFPGKPMLIQETGEQRRLWEDDSLRFSAPVEGWQLERKLAMAFAQGAGALEWVWNVNSYMANDNEITIGAVRPDGTEKPEAEVLAGFAHFAAQSPASFTHLAPPEVAIVASQALQYSNQNATAVEVQKHALRALAYDDHTPARMLSENRLTDLGTSTPSAPKLVILPLAQALTSAAWQQLLAYVEAGGTLLVSGPIERDEHWHPVDRLASVGLQAQVLPLSTRASTLRLEGEQPVEVSLSGSAQIAPFEVLRFASGKSLENVAHGKGRILWAADPVELSEGYAASAALYRYALRVAGVAPAFKELTPLSPGVLAFPTVLKDAVLYSFSNESLDAQLVDLHDALTGAHLHFTLGGQRGAMLLLSKHGGKVLATYGEAAALQP